MNFTNILLVIGLILSGLTMIVNVLDIDIVDEDIAKIISIAEKLGITLLVIGGIGSVVMGQIELRNL